MKEHLKLCVQVAAASESSILLDTSRTYAAKNHVDVGKGGKGSGF